MHFRPGGLAPCVPLQARLRGLGTLGVFGRPTVRGVPEEVLADSLFADVEDRADLVEGAAEFPDLVSGAFAADPRSLAGEDCAGFVQCLVPFGGPTLGLFGFALCFYGGGRGEDWCSVVVAGPAAPCAGDTPDNGGPAVSFTLAACSFYVAGLLVLAERVGRRRLAVSGDDLVLPGGWPGRGLTAVRGSAPVL